MKIILTRSQRRSLFITGFLLFIVIILTAGHFYYKYAANSYRKQIEQELSAIADLKVKQIKKWREERIGDVSIFYKNYAFSSLLKRYVSNTNDVEVEKSVKNWMANVQNHYNYENTFLLDTNRVRLLSIPEIKSPLSSFVSNSFSDVLKSKQISFVDFYRDEYDNKIHLAILVPILDNQDSSSVLGILGLRIDPSEYLYPFISEWPTVSETSETLIFRREGDEIVFLNDLKFQENTALNLRAAMNGHLAITAIKAVQGEEGIVEALDYRGVKVIAALRKINDSPWFIVARMDKEEAFAPLKQRLLIIAILVGLIIIAFTISFFVFIRQQNLRFYREKEESLKKVNEELEEKVIERTSTLLENETRLIKAQQTAHLGFLDWDLKTNEIICSDEVYYLYGIDLSEKPITLEKISKGIHPDDAEFVQKNLELAAKGEKEYNIDHRIQKPTGEILWVNAQAHLEYDAEGKPKTLLGTILDITYRKKAEKTILTLKQEMQIILDSVRAWIFYKDKENKYIKVNKAFADVMNRPKEQLENVSLFDLYPKEQAEAFWKDDKEIIESGKSRMNIIEPMDSPDGLRWVQTDKIPYIDSDGKLIGVIGFTLDITERKKAEDARAKALFEIEEKNKELQTFLYIASHDLQEPLRKVQGFGDMLKKKYAENLGETGADYINRMQSASARMQKLIDALLNYSRVTTKANPFEKVDLNLIVHDVISEYDTLIEKANANIIIEKLPIINADEFQVHQVFYNLMSNAIKFRRKDVPLEIKIYPIPNRTKSKHTITIAVEDNGIGIDKKYSNKVFEVFEKLHNQQEYEGTGIGLAICKKIIERHNGKITFESIPENGTRFLLKLNTNSTKKDKL